MRSSLLLMLIIVCSCVYAQTWFTGSLKVNGQNAPVGTTLQGIVEGIIDGSATVSTAGKYTLMVTNDMWANYITFRIKTPQMLSYAEKTILFDPEVDLPEGLGTEDEPYVLDLDFEVELPTPTPTATPSPTPTVSPSPTPKPTRTPKPTATRTPGGGPGGGGRGGGGGAPPTLTPSPLKTITPLETPPRPPRDENRNVIFESTYEYKPTAEEVASMLAKAGYSQEFINRALKQLNYIKIKKTLRIEKITNVNGKVSYESVYVIKVTNISDDILFGEVIISEYIPKNIAKKASDIKSDMKFEIVQEDPVIQWLVKELGPWESVTIEYKVIGQLAPENLAETKTFFQATNESKVVGLAKLIVNVKDPEGRLIEGKFNVSVYDKAGNKVKEGTTEKGRIVFSLSAGTYKIEVAESQSYVKGTAEVKLKAGETKSVDVKVALKTTPRPTGTVAPTPKPYSPELLLLIIIICLVVFLLYYFITKRHEKPRAKERLREEKESEERGAAPAVVTAEKEKPEEKKIEPEKRARIKRPKRKPKRPEHKEKVKEEGKFKEPIEYAKEEKPKEEPKAPAETKEEPKQTEQKEEKKEEQPQEQTDKKEESAEDSIVG
ncbi:MAG: DUF4493 domain-containing protein [Candidatus Diapherotrites archaeon]|nr:DUF4493 domain-containing protein [Candidatus Diapherotrites archaeon]